MPEMKIKELKGENGREIRNDRVQKSTVAVLNGKEFFNLDLI